MNLVKNKTSFNLNTFSLVLLALLPLIPLFAPRHFIPIVSFHSEWLAIIFGLLAWLLALPLLWRQQNLLIPRLTLLPLLLMAFIAVQAQLLPQVIIQHAQMGMLYLLWAALLMVLVKLLLAQTDRQYVSQWIAIGLSTAAVFATVIEIIYRLKGISGWWGGAGQANNYGDLLALGLASVLYLLAISNPVWRVYLLIAAVVIISGLSLTPSRSVWLYWLAMLALSLLLQRGMVKWLIIGLGLYLLLQALWAFEPSFISQPATTAITGEIPATAAESLYQKTAGPSTRLHIWNVAWQLFTDAPWLGQGFGQFDWGYFQAGQPIPELPERLEHAHNLFLHLLAELGLFPVLVLLGLLSLWLKDISTAITEKKQADDNKSLSFYFWLLMLLAILGIHSLLEYPLWYAQFLGVAAIILALGETKHWQLRLKPVFALAVSVLVSVGIAIASVHEWHYTKIEAAFNNHKEQSNQVFVNAAAKAPLLAPYVAIIFSISSDLTNEEMRPDLTTLNNVSYHFLPSATLAYQKAELEALNGFKNEAQQTLKLALLAYPDWGKNFIPGLTVLNSVDQEKTAFLRTMAEERLEKLSY